MKLTTRLLGASMLLFALSGSAQAAINLVQNGGFEDTVLTTSTQITTTNVAHWSNSVVFGYNGYYNLLYFPGQAGPTGVGAFIPDNGGIPNNFKLWAVSNSPDGGNFLAADGGDLVRSAITQTIEGLTKGHKYSLTFDWAGAQELYTDGANTEQWQVSLGSETHSTTQYNNPAHGYSGWMAASMEFTATGASEVLSFLSIGGPTYQPPMVLLDGVSLTDQTAPPVDAVPEPATWAMLVVGMGVVGAAVRRRRRVAHTVTA